MPYRKLLLLSALLAIILAPLNTLQPYLINVIVDKYIIIPRPEGLVGMCILFAVVLITTGILQYTFIYLTNLLGHSVIKDLRVSVFNKITNLRLSYFDKTPIGNLTTRSINDIETIKRTKFWKLHQIRDIGKIRGESALGEKPAHMAAKKTVAWRMHVGIGIGMAVMMAMMGCPPKRTALDTGGADRGENKLHRPRSAERFVRKIPVVKTGDGKHANGIQAERHP